MLSPLRRTSVWNCRKGETTHEEKTNLCNLGGGRRAFAGMMAAVVLAATTAPGSVVYAAELPATQTVTEELPHLQRIADLMTLMKWQTKSRR